MKYPRTAHLPQSPGGTRDDRRLPDLSNFVGRRLVATEKLDGSNVCLQEDACFARSHGHVPVHPSFDAFKALHAAVRGRIRPGLQIFGEWCYAKHSIHYTALPSYFLAIGVRNLETQRWAEWETVTEWADELGVSTVPVLGRVQADSEKDLLEYLDLLNLEPASRCGGEREGFVVRWADAFADADFDRAVGKYVRAGHVQTDEHWQSQQLVKNLLAVKTYP